VRGSELARKRSTSELTAGLLILSLCINLLGSAAVAFMHLPLYLDMIGTGLMSLALGPWWGCFVAAASGVMAQPFNGPSQLPMTLVACVGALCWGYGVRHLRGTVRLTRFVALNAAVAAACTVVAVPLLLLFCDGATGHAGDVVSAGFFSMGEPEFVSVLQGNLLLSLVDKLLSGFIILMLLSALGRRRLLPRGGWVVDLRISLMMAGSGRAVPIV
jgi:energy-coupling factor transport system substrate-specific component